jgi:hypothetical protein
LIAAIFWHALNFNCYFQMLENTLNSSIMAGQQEEAADLDTAGRMLEKHIAYDSCFPALTDKLQIMPKGLVS